MFPGNPEAYLPDNSALRFMLRTHRAEIDELKRRVYELEMRLLDQERESQAARAVMVKSTAAQLPAPAIDGEFHE